MWWSALWFPWMWWDGGGLHVTQGEVVTCLRGSYANGVTAYGEGRLLTSWSAGSTVYRTQSISLACLIFSPVRSGPHLVTLENPQLVDLCTRCQICIQPSKIWGPRTESMFRRSFSRHPHVFLCCAACFSRGLFSITQAFSFTAHESRGRGILPFGRTRHIFKSLLNVNPPRHGEGDWMPVSHKIKGHLGASGQVI
jgi:hypothetical protein